MNRKDRRAAKSSGVNVHGSPQTESLYNQAIAHHQAGRLDQAHQLYKKIIETEPDHADSLHMAGVLATQTGKPETAIEFIVQAIKLRDNVPHYHCNLGNALFALGKFDEAAMSYRKAIKLKKDLPEAYNGLGNALNKKGKLDEAAGQYAHAIALRPNHDGFYSNFGALLRDQGKFGEAIVQLKKAIALAPNSADAHNTLGLVLRDQGIFHEAMDMFKRAIALNPHFAEAYNSLGLVLKDQGMLAEAVAQYEHALLLNPVLASVYGNLGNALQELKRFDESLAAHRKGLEINPQNATGYINLGSTFVDLKRAAEALPWYDKAIALEPENATAYSNRGVALKELGRLEESLESFDKAYKLAPDYEGLAGLRMYLKMMLCDWSEYGSAGHILEKIREGRFVATPFTLLTLPATAEDQLKCAKLFVSHKNPPVFVPFYTGSHVPHKKIRVAYLSADLHEHATAYLMAGLFEAHDRSKFETTAISYGPDDKSKMRERLVSAFDHFIDAQLMSDDRIAHLMLEREIDIAVDLKGFTQNYRAGIFVKRAAPLQVSYIGYPGTTGAPYIDYIIADKTVIPAEMQSSFTEKIAYLPDSYQVNDRKRAASPRIPGRAELGLPEKAFVFCSFNANFKITPDVFDVWMRLLKSVDNSVLWLFEGSKTAVANLRREAQQRGVAPERLVFAPKMKIEDHLARHHQADLFLDNLPCNAHTTASDALWMGLPVLTCLGGTFAGRVAGSLLKAVGLPELVTHSMNEYEQLALQLAHEPQKLAALKAKLVQNRDICPLFNTERFTRHLEAAYLAMWQRYQQDSPPETFEVCYS